MVMAINSNHEGIELGEFVEGLPGGGTVVPLNLETTQLSLLSWVYRLKRSLVVRYLLEPQDIILAVYLGLVLFGDKIQQFIIEMISSSSPSPNANRNIISW